MKYKRYAVFAAAFLLAAMTGCTSQAEISGGSSEATAEQSQASGDENLDDVGAFGSFTSYTLNGEEVNEDIFSEADLTMVNIWGTFCRPCINEMPDLGEIADEYEDKGMQMLGVISDVYETGDATAQEIIDKTGADYTHIILTEDIYNNYVYQVRGVPTTVFVDSEGRQVGDAIMGSKSKEKWIAIIEEKISEAAGDEE